MRSVVDRNVVMRRIPVRISAITYMPVILNVKISCFIFMSKYSQILVN